MKSLIALFLGVLLVSCSSVNVNYDYEKNTNFSQYKTYNYYQNLNTGLSELDSRRLLDAIDASLALKGMQLSKSPDFLINIKSSEHQEAPSSNVGIGVGGGGGNVGGGISVGFPLGQGHLNRQIVIDFIDAEKNSLFWQALSADSFNPEASPQEREQQLKTIVEKVFSAYPPKSN